MTRPTNLEISDRILNAAREAWRKGGNEAFDLRSIATSANTTVATLYARFASRDDLLRALRKESLDTFFKAMSRATTVRAFCEAYLKFAETRPKDYELIFGPRWRNRAEPADVEELVGRLAKRVADERLDDLAASRSKGLQLWLMLHGAAAERVTDKTAGPLWGELKAACLAGCSSLLERAK